MNEETQEIEVDVEQTYAAAMHSVYLINRMYEAGETV